MTPTPDKFRGVHWAVLGAAAAVYLLLTVPFLSPAYYDLGDGNYLYVAWRTTQGLKPYRDILAPQPPVHLFSGAALVALGEAIGGDARLYVVRAFNLALHLATMLIIAALALKMFRRASVAAAAGVIYLFLPIGFWWTQMFESEQTQMFFLLAGLWFMLDFTPRRMAAAAPLHALAVFTNMTAVPYVALFSLWLLLRRPRLLLWYLGPLLAICAAGVIFMHWWSEGWYLNNVFFNQVGTYPEPAIIGQPLWQYMLGKIVREGGDVMMWEGGWVVMSFVGMILYYRNFGLRTSDFRFEKQRASEEMQSDSEVNAVKSEIENPKSQIHLAEFSIIFALGFLGSITFATKGGTADYIFTIGEPAVALFAAYLLVGHLWPAMRGAGASYGGAGILPAYNMQELSPTPSNMVAPALAMLGLAIILGGFGFVFIARNVNGGNYELTADKTTSLRAAIETYAPPGAPILAPPFFGFLTERPIISEYSEHFIWNIKFITETHHKQPAEAVALFNEIAAALECREIPIVLLDGNQTAQRQPVRRAIEAHYVRAPGFPADVQMLNTTLGVYIPRKN